MNTRMSLTEALSQSGLEVIDFVILLVYIILIVSLGVFLSHNNESKTKSATDYFLAGNTLTCWAVGASLIAANISTEQFIGMAGSGYADGIAIAAYEIMAAVTLVVIGKFLLPVMMERKVLTFPQFLRQRYNNGVGLAFSIFWLFLYILVNLTSVAWLGALAIEQIMGFQGLTINMLGIDMSVRMMIVLALFLVAGLYSVYGGMTSVAWTDVIQTVFIIGGGLATAYYAVCAVAGGEGSFVDGCQNLYNFLLDREYEKDAHFHLVVQESRNPQAFSNIPGITAIVGGLWLTNLSYWAFNQYITQKGLAARSIQEAQKGFIFAAFLKIVIPFIVVVPGICAFYLMHNIDSASQLQSAIHVSDDAYPWLIHNFIPTGIKGLAFIAITASIISSLASMLNSTATIFTIDIYRKYISPDASDQKIVGVGRIAAIVTLLFAVIAVNPLLGGLDQAFQYIQEYSGFIYPGIVVVFGLGLLWKRASATASIWTTIFALPVAVAFKIFFPEVPFLLRVGYVFMILFALFVTISLCSKRSVASQPVSAEYRSLMMKWGYILGTLSILSILVAAVVSIGTLMLPPDATPDNNVSAYLNDIGFQSVYFFGVLLCACALSRFSNARSPIQDPKALPINFSLFITTRGYIYGSIAVCTITLLLYIIFW